MRERERERERDNEGRRDAETEEEGRDGDGSIDRKSSSPKYALHTERVIYINSYVGHTSSQRNWSIVCRLQNTKYNMHNFCELLFQP